MRLWSLHPSYLDAKGLVALWREGLLARAVLAGKTKGYRNHPQLERFKAHPTPLPAIDSYLWEVFEEAERRGYHFDRTKLGARRPCTLIPVTDGQLRYEWEHLQKKLQIRDPQRFRQNKMASEILPHPLMQIVPGDVADWERWKEDNQP